MMNDTIDTVRRSILTLPLAGGIASFVPACLAAADVSSSAVRIERLAWAGIRVEVADAVLFVDAIAPVPANGQPGPALEAGSGRNFALVTHHHGDHCDLHALAAVLGDKGFLLCHEETGRLLDPRIVRLQVTRMFEPRFLSPANAEFAVFAVPAVDGLGSPQVSWVIDMRGRRIIHCGDTAWHGHFWDIGRAYGPFDLAFLPINGFRQTEGRFRHVERPMSMTPEEAIAAAEILGARAVVPIHFGLASPDYVEVPNALAVFAELAARKGIKVVKANPGTLLEGV
jgi:L-ascorbate metabolism protein UlaG (beta-lactamase superfamily)